MDSDSSSGVEPPSCSLDCTLLSAVTRLDAASCSTPVTSLMLAPEALAAGITMRMDTPPLSTACSLLAPGCLPRWPRSSARASWYQMARPGPSSASDVTHCSLCMGYGDAEPAVSAPSRRRRRASHEPLPALSVSLKYSVSPVASVVLLSCTCSSGRPTAQARPERSESPSSGTAAKMRTSGMGIAMPNSTAAGSMAAGALLALGEAVEVPVADEPAVELADGLSVSGAEADAVADGEPVDDRVRAGVRVSDVGAVPVCEGDGVPVVEPVTDEDGVTLFDGLELPVREEDAPAVSELDGVPVVLAVLAAVPEAVWLVLGSGEPLRVLLDVGLLVLVGEPLGRAVLEPVPVRLGVPVVVAGGDAVTVDVPGGVPDPEPVPDAVADGFTPGDREAVAVALSLPVAVTEAESLGVPVVDGCADLVAVLELDRLRDAVAVALREPVPVELDDGVPVWLPVPVELLELVLVKLDDGVPVWLPVPVELLGPVPVELDDGVPVWLPVLERVSLDEPV